jgi:four helix bundle protein
MGDYRSLKVWEKAHRLTLRVYEVTRAFPAAEQYGLTSQIRRAVASIPTNIAEGAGRNRQAELAQFCRIALGSANEVDYQLLLARDLGYLPPELHSDLSRDAAEVKRMLAAFITTLV